MIQIKFKLKNLQKKNNYLLERIKECNKLKGITIDDELHHGLNEIMKQHSEEIQKKYNSNSFHCLFWNEQIKIQQNILPRGDGTQCLFIGVFILR